MKNLASLPATVLLPLVIVFTSNPRANAGQIPNDPRDVVALSQRTWGSSIDEFPSRAGLQAGQFQKGDDPVPGSTDKVIIAQAGAWTPTELPPFELKFASDRGLYEITGFLGKQLDKATLLNRLVQRYGMPDNGSIALGFASYTWTFSRSVLAVSFNGDKPFLYTVAPKK